MADEDLLRELEDRARGKTPSSPPDLAGLASRVEALEARVAPLEEAAGTVEVPGGG